MKRIKLRKSKREMKHDEKEKQKRRRKKGILTKAQKEERKDEITSQKEWVEKASMDELVEWLEKKYYTSIAKKLERDFVDKRSEFEIIAFLEERYSTSRALPAVEAILKLCKNYKLLKAKLKEKGDKTDGTREAKVHPVRIGRIKRNVVQEHRQHRVSDTTKAGKVAPEKRSIHRAKRGS